MPDIGESFNLGFPKNLVAMPPNKTDSLGALQVPFGEFTGFHYVALDVTNPKWHPVTCSETQRDILYGSEKPEVDGSTRP